LKWGKGMIEIQNLTKIYKKQTVLNDVNLRLEMGKICGLVGVNGSGKTTLMRCIAGFAKPTKGKVVVDGCIVGKDIDFPDKMGVIIENPGFLPSYNAFFNLKILSRVSGKAADERIRKVITEMGLDPDNLKPVGQYSLGMRGRLGIAQALIHHPKVIIVDEPTTGLDPEERIRFRNLLSEVSENDVTIILSTHIVGDISSTCNNMALMNRGEVSFYGSPQDMLKKAEGKVWRIRAGGDQLHEIDKKYPVISTIPSGTAWEVQVVADKVEGYEAEPFPPNLEHAYVYYMENQLNLWTND